MTLSYNLSVRLNEDGSVAEVSRQKKFDLEVYPNFFSEFNSDYWVYNGTELVLIDNAEAIRDAALAAEVEAEAAKSIKQEKDTAISAAVTQFEAEAAAIKGGYSQAVIDTFSIQESEAMAWTADNSAKTPLLDAILSESGESIDVLAKSIIANAEALKTNIGKAIGRQAKKIKDA